MQVALPTSKDFGIEGGAKRVHTRCVCPGETSTIKYHVTPYALGKIKILATVSKEYFPTPTKIRTIKYDIIIWS